LDASTPDAGVVQAPDGGVLDRPDAGVFSQDAGLFAADASVAGDGGFGCREACGKLAWCNQGGGSAESCAIGCESDPYHAARLVCLASASCGSGIELCQQTPPAEPE